MGSHVFVILLCGSAPLAKTIRGLTGHFDEAKCYGASLTPFTDQRSEMQDR